jgi:hypothetical protein
MPCLLFHYHKDNNEEDNIHEDMAVLVLVLLLVSMVLVLLVLVLVLLVVVEVEIVKEHLLAVVAVVVYVTRQPL